MIQQVGGRGAVLLIASVQVTAAHLFIILWLLVMAIRIIRMLVWIVRKLAVWIKKKIFRHHQAHVNDPDCSVGLLSKIAHGRYLLLRGLVVCHPRCPPETVAWLAEQEHKDTQPGIPGADMVLYGAGERPLNAEEIRTVAVARSNCPVSTLWRLARGPDPTMWRAVISNPACPAEILVFLAQRPEPGWGQLVAGHPNCPDHVRAIIILSG